MSADIIDFDGVVFLDKLENVFQFNGMKGVQQLIKQTFPIGQKMRMKPEIGNRYNRVYEIERVVFEKVNPQVIVLELGDKSSVSIIRSLSLPYVEDPFQITIYGT